MIDTYQDRYSAPVRKGEFAIDKKNKSINKSQKGSIIHILSYPKNTKIRHMQVSEMKIHKPAKISDVVVTHGWSTGIVRPPTKFLLHFNTVLDK